MAVVDTVRAETILYHSVEFVVVHVSGHIVDGKLQLTEQYVNFLLIQYKCKFKYFHISSGSAGAPQYLWRFNGRKSWLLGDWN